nr:myrosinase 1 [Helicoverpa armigera]
MNSTMCQFWGVLFLALLYCVNASVLNNEIDSPVCFKDGFLFGVATAAYQIEGAWNVSGKGVSIWDKLTHEEPEKIFDHSNGDIADGSYYKVKEDVRLIKELGVSLYRFSVSWPRILPNGLSYKINEDGIRYYNEVIDELIRNNITPAITIFHWDLPQYLRDMGGWTNALMADFMVEYSRILFENFGDRVKIWMTFNEPLTFCQLSDYAGADNPEGSGIKSYLCGHNVIRAHGMVYRMFEEEYRPKIGGEMGIVISYAWEEPYSDSEEDQAAAERARNFQFGWFAHPIFSEAGDYPPIMRSVVDKNSKEQGFPSSRLPSFTPGEVKMIKGSADFLGLNHYTTRLVQQVPKNNSNPTSENDINVKQIIDEKWPKTGSSWLSVVPWGFRKTLNWLKVAYNNPKILVTENGMSTGPGLDDKKRIEYIDGYLRSLHDAVYEDGCNVVGYTYWSLMDNFEWKRGYSERFGLYEVDYESPNLTRTPRLSAKYYTSVAKTGCLPDSLADLEL